MLIDHHAWKKLKLILKNKEKITKMICYTNAYEPRTENFSKLFCPKTREKWPKIKFETTNA